MGNIVEKFGNYVGGCVENEPDRARRLLLAAYRCKLVQLKHFPDKRLSPARDILAEASMKAIIAGLAHPEDSALVNLFMPCEILHVLGIHPIMAEAMASYVTGARADRGFVAYAEKCGIPETFCSYHKVMLAEALSGIIGTPRFIANTSFVCDANNLTFKTAAKHYGVPHFYIDVPYEVSEDSVAYVADQLREFVPFAEECACRKLDEDELKACVARSAVSMKNFEKFQNAKAGKFLSNDPTNELYEIFANHILLGKPEIEKFSYALAAEGDTLPDFDGISLLWMHTIPFYQKDILSITGFNEKVQIISCDMNFAGYIDVDPEKPYDAMARRLVYDSFNGPSERRISRALEWCRKQKVDGVVYFCHWGCKQTLGAAQLAKETIEAAGYPVLVLDGDGCDEGNSSSGQTATRFEAFIEMLEARKKK